MSSHRKQLTIIPAVVAARIASTVGPTLSPPWLTGRSHWATTGDNTITGGLGDDSFLAADGNDLFYARDAMADTINGGLGANAAQIDPGLDSVTNIQTLLA
jgi:Ca2+-binding RTX toxin-like protein